MGVCSTGFRSKTAMDHEPDLPVAPRAPKEDFLKELSDLLREADAAILRAETPQAARNVCEQSHSEVASMMLAWRDRQKTSMSDLREWCRAAREGMEVAVPLPPLPLVDKKEESPQEEPEAAPVDATGFDWLFLSAGNDIISTLKAGPGFSLVDLILPLAGALRRGSRWLHIAVRDSRNVEIQNSVLRLVQQVIYHGGPASAAELGVRVRTRFSANISNVGSIVSACLRELRLSEEIVTRARLPHLHWTCRWTR